MPRLVGRAWPIAVCLAALAAAGRAAEPARQDAVDLSVVTFNVLVDFSREPGVPAWNDRKDLCAELLRATAADVIALQEPSPKQTSFFLEQLPDYRGFWYQKGKSQYTDVVLLYHAGRLRALDNGQWWLSPTPEKISTGFGNTLPRLVVWAKLEHLASGKQFFAAATHFDNSQPSQARMAELCQTQFEPLVAEGLPLVFLGDFNTDQKRGDYQRLVSNGWRDAYRASPLASPEGRDENVPTHGRGTRIDHIFYHGDALEAAAWERLESPDPQRRLSDHWPVLARFRWR